MSRMCNTCIHNGCCDDLHYCCGLYYKEDPELSGSERDPWEGYDPDDERDARAEAWLERNEP